MINQRQEASILSCFHKLLRDLFFPTFKVYELVSLGEFSTVKIIHYLSKR